MASSEDRMYDAKQEQAADELQSRMDALTPDTREWVASRQVVNGCALVDGWCLVHDARDTMDHHFTVHPNAYND